MLLALATNSSIKLAVLTFWIVLASGTSNSFNLVLVNCSNSRTFLTDLGVTIL